MLRFTNPLAGLIALTLSLNSWAAEFLRHGSWVSGGDGAFAYSASTLGVGRNQGSSLRLTATQGECDRLTIEGASVLARGIHAPLHTEVGEFDLAAQIDSSGIRKLRAIGRFDEKTRRVLWMLKPEQVPELVSAMRSGSVLWFAAPAPTRVTDGALGELSLTGLAVALDRVHALCTSEEPPSLRLDLSQRDAEALCSAYLKTRADYKNERYRFQPLKGDRWNATLKGALSAARDDSSAANLFSCYLVKRAAGWIVAGSSMP